MPDDTKTPREPGSNPPNPPGKVVDLASHRGKKKKAKSLTSLGAVRRAATEGYNTFRAYLSSKGDKWTPEEANALARWVDLNRKVLVEADLEKKVDELEKAIKGAQS